MERFKGNLLFRLAEPVSVDVDVVKRINWIVDTGYAYGNFTIKANGALSTSINFDQFYLPKGTEMYIYNQNGKMITGPITENENNPNKIWGSWVYKGPFLTIEIKTPVVTKNSLVLHLNNIAYGYKRVYEDFIGGFGQSAQACEINVVCALGTGWEAERNAVAAILISNGSISCSGALIMNTCGTNRPFFLAANHSYNADNNVAGWRFQFQAWSSTCPNPGTNTDGVTYNGATLRANWDGPTHGSDFCLLELNTTPPANSGLNYAGWNRSTTGITQTTILHHPKNDLMKITRDINPPVFGTYGTPEYWQLQVDNGTLEPGSSGAPFFDQNHRIIGQMRGTGDAGLPACQQKLFFGGRFNESWTGGGTSATRLSDWLAPNGSTATTTNTTNIANLTPANPALVISGNPLFCTGSSTYTLTGAPAGSTITWLTSDASVGSIPPPPYGNTVSVTRVNAGNIVLTASVSSCPQPLTVTKSIHIGGFSSSDYPVTGPSPSLPTCGNYVYFSTNQLYGATGYTWTYPSSWFASGYTTNSLALQIPSGTSGNFVVGVRVANSCDAGGSYATKTFTVTCSGFAPQFTVSPNPATNEITVTAAETAKIGTTPVITALTIYDQQGLLKKSQRFGNVRSARMNLTGLATGVYFIEIRNGDKTVRQQLSILK